jgi:hypothetical protein
MRSFLVFVLAAMTATVASAQVQSRPTEAPLVTAENEAWYVHGDPVQFAGSTYYRAGASIFFDGNRMVRTGSFNSVPLYADTTVEPFSLLYVPIGRNLMQPYERPRSGDLAGTVGSRAPSFPVSAQPTSSSMAMSPSAPTSLIPVLLDDAVGGGGDGVARTRLPIAATPDAPAAAEAVRETYPAATPEALQAVRQQVWVEFRGQKWVPAGPAIQLAGSGLVRSAEYAGFPVYTDPAGSAGARIYLPALGGLVTPYDLKQ